MRNMERAIPQPQTPIKSADVAPTKQEVTVTLTSTEYTSPDFKHEGKTPDFVTSTITQAIYGKEVTYVQISETIFQGVDAEGNRQNIFIHRDSLLINSEPVKAENTGKLFNFGFSKSGNAEENAA